MNKEDNLKEIQERLVKLGFVSRINRIVQDRNLSALELSALLGIDKEATIALLKYESNQFTQTELISFLNKLGVTITFEAEQDGTQRINLNVPKPEKDNYE